MNTHTDRTTQENPGTGNSTTATACLDFIVFLGLLFLLSSCGTGPEFDPLPLSKGWAQAGLEGQRVRMLQREGQYIYAGTDAGLYRQQASENSTRWQSMGLKKDRIADIVVFDSDNILAAIHLSDRSLKNPSLFLTTNAGVSWQVYQNGFGGPGKYTAIEKLEQDPTKPDILYATHTGHFVRSTDRGKSWQLPQGTTWEPFIGGSYVLKADPHRHGTVWQGGVDGLFEPVLRKSPDYGNSFLPLGNFQYNDQGVLVETTVYDLIIHSFHSDSVLVGEAGGVTPGNGIKRTVDGGQNWTKVYAQTPVYALAADPTTPDRVYASGVNADSTLFFVASPDFGTSWSQQVVNQALGGTYTYSLLADTLQGRNILYLGTNKGVHRYVFPK